MAGHTYFIAFSVSEISAIVGWSVFGPETRLPLRGAAAPECHSIYVVDDRPTLS
jgi:hypothetical protein